MAEILPSGSKPNVLGRVDASRRCVVLILAPTLAAGIFILDTISPLQFAVAVLYVVVVVAATVFGQQGVLITASACSVLTIVSYLIAHGLRIEGTAPLRSLMSLAAIATTTILVLTNLTVSANLWASERKRVNLSRYFSTQLIEQLAETNLPLSVARFQPATIMFVDMVGFTAYSARLPPAAVIELLRELLGLLSKAVFAHNGVIDKFLGDGLMAVFGSPLGGPADATNAARCALNILQTVEQWNDARRQGGQATIQVCIGVHSGDVVFGDIGSETRLELTVLGDTVNVASRVEAYCRVLGAEILTTAAFIKAVHAEGGHSVIQSFVDQGFHSLRGYVDPVHLYGIKRGVETAPSCTR